MALPAATCNQEKLYLRLGPRLCFFNGGASRASHGDAEKIPSGSSISCALMGLASGSCCVQSGLGWLLRVGEVFLEATRADLLLPADSAPGTSRILLRIKAPKTRGRAAKHQAAPVDPQDLVQLISTVLGLLQSCGCYQPRRSVRGCDSSWSVLVWWRRAKRLLS